MRRRRFVVGIACTLVLALPLTIGLVSRAGSTTGHAAKKLDKRYMDPESAHSLKASAQDLAGNSGEPNSDTENPLKDPNGAATDEFMRKAIPAGTIPASAASNSIQTWGTYGENKQYTGNANNTNHPFDWSLIGPTHATQPGILSFSGAQFHMAGRVTAMISTPTCSSNSNCRLWVAAAGGGIWRTDNPFSPDPYWVFVSQSFRSNAIGTIDRDPSDPSGNTLYAGTGEPNASGDSESGVGIYKTTDGGDHWTLLTGSQLFATRSISKVVVDPTNPNHLYAGIARGVRGISSVTGGVFSRTGPCVQFPAVLSCGDGPDQAPLGLWESTDGGTTWNLAWDTSLTSVRGVNDVGLDPSDPTCVYASAFQLGLWRRCPTADGSPTFKQVFRTSSPTENTSRTQFDLTSVTGTGADAGTRIYVSDGSTGASGRPSQVWRADGANLLTAAALLTTEGAPNTHPPSPNTGPGWARKSSLASRPASNPYRPAYNPCTGQCWYDEDVYTPKGYPNIVYLLGSYQYAELHERSNGRAVMISLTAGDPDPTTAATAPVPNPAPPFTGGPFTTDVSGGNFTDLTWDDTPGAQPDQIHPDEHALITASDNPYLFFEGSDGGMIRSDGQFDNASADCARYHFNDADTLVHCQRVLSRVPHQLYDVMNKGLSTLQFQSLSVNPDRPQSDAQGGTQDNGTFQWTGQPTQWWEEMYGDGGQSGYNYCDTKIRFNTFFGYYTDENFQNGQPDKWYITSGPLSQANNGEIQSFYIPEVTDYTNCGPLSNFPQFQTPAAVAANTNQTQPAGSSGGQLGATLGFQYAGLQHVWRTIDNGGPEAYLQSCPEFTTSGDDPRCGDWQPLGDPAYTGPGHHTNNEPGDLTSTQYGADRLAGTVVATERNPGNNNELWAATSYGRLFVTFNVNAVLPSAVQFCRLDSVGVVAPAPASGNVVPPPRFISSIYPDPANPNRAWVSYDGYNSNTKDQPGHVFEVTFTGATTSGSGCPTAAVWRDLLVEGASATHSDPAGDIPITDLVRDDYTGDLYAATDFGVLRDAGGLVGTWTEAGVNLPRVETPGLTIDPCSRLLYAATHGRSAWRMYLPDVAATKNLKGCPRTP
ncbi:MAG: hypothetical protein QOE36_1045 [Gaiellaceae bacterium]|jgi:hypothetical protein|nr:hypothetical protein [Gaiellaceae bacterium]